MSTLQRYLCEPVSGDLEEKMVFLGGPRQVGKTVFSQSLIKGYKDGHAGYFNWDNSHDREKLKRGDFEPNQRLLIFDEIHKFAKWRSLVKGYFDKLKNTHQFLITGSARLDYYRKGGDSLLGRYYYYRMHPLSLNELNLNTFKGKFDQLLEFGGFPEPFLRASKTHLKRWHRQRRDRIVYTDIRDLENVKDISNMEVLMESLPERVGSPLSRKNLAQDLGVDFKTIEKWITILENVYYCFRISPFGAPKIKAVKKEQKLYLWDWSELENPGARFENFVASHLLKYCHYFEDTEGDKMELRFLRDVLTREIDFVVLKNKVPIFAVECKTGERSLSKSIAYFADRLKIPKIYQVHQGTVHRQISDQVAILPFSTFASIVGLV